MACVIIFYYEILKFDVRKILNFFMNFYLSTEKYLLQHFMSHSINVQSVVELTPNDYRRKS